MGEPFNEVGADDATTAIGRARATLARTRLTIEAPGPRSSRAPLSAVLFGVPWLLGVTVAGLWYIGWGSVPESAWVRILLWLVALALTHNLSTLAYLAIWNAFYHRIGTETLTIDPEYIVVVRRAGRFKRELRIGRKIIERAEVLPEDARKPGRGRIEIRSWRSAIGFGAGLDADEATECARMVQEQFDRDEAVRHAAEAASGRVRALAETFQGPDDAADGVTEDDAGPTRVMQTYREALESRGTIRSRLGAVASVAKARTRRNA